MVDSMHERKVEMAKRSVGFIGLPGGFGTFEEVCSAVLCLDMPIKLTSSPLTDHGSDNLDSIRNS